MKAQLCVYCVYFLCFMTMITIFSFQQGLAPRQALLACALQERRDITLSLCASDNMPLACCTPVSCFSLVYPSWKMACLCCCLACKRVNVCMRDVRRCLCMFKCYNIRMETCKLSLSNHNDGEEILQSLLSWTKTRQQKTSLYWPQNCSVLLSVSIGPPCVRAGLFVCSNELCWIWRCEGTLFNFQECQQNVWIFNGLVAYVISC